MFAAPTESEIQEAYKEGVKQWHPDLYQNFEFLRADAEEHFKQIQIAYRELKEHNTVSAEAPVERTVVRAATVVVEPKQEETPSISFGGAPGCLTAKQFTREIEEMIAPHLGRLGMAQAIVDLSGKKSLASGLSQFLLLAARGMMMRDVRNVISVLWYTDMGAVNLIDRQRGGKQSSWQKIMGGISGSQPSYELQINRSNGASFCSISGQADDAVKTIIYNFLMSQKPQAQP
jgi:hypothetical protein